MTATTVQLDDEERAILAELESEFGVCTDAIKQGLLLLVDRHRRRRALDEFMDEWIAESGPPDPEGVAEMRERYFGDT